MHCLCFLLCRIENVVKFDIEYYNKMTYNKENVRKEFSYAKHQTNL